MQTLKTQVNIKIPLVYSLYTFDIFIILESETGICAFSRNQVECLREPENQRYANNLNRSFRRQRLQSTTGHQRRGFTTLPNRNDSRSLHNDATQLNYNLYDKRLTRMSFDAENAPNKTETDGGQTLIRNEINGTTYRFDISL